jgi:2-C-methyl-D-erythritol 2,4-cyclodiphosphate synthase
VCNVDVSIVAERPNLAPFVAEMRGNIGNALGIHADLVSVKGTTSKGLGFLGRGEGIAAHAVALVEKAGEDRRAGGQ